MLLATAAAFKHNLLISHTLVALSPVTLLASSVSLARPGSAGRLYSSVAVLVLVTLSISGAAVAAVTPRTNAPLLAAFVSHSATSDDLVIVAPASLVSSFLRYYRGMATVEDYPQGEARRPIQVDERLRRDTDPVAVNATLIRAREVLQSGGNVWVVMWAQAIVVRPGVTALASMMTTISGPPMAIDVDRVTPAAEVVSLRVWRGRRVGDSNLPARNAR